MTVDLAGALRRLKPTKRTGSLQRRPDHALPLLGPKPVAGPPLLIDTTVYIDVLQGRAPPELVAMLRLRQVNHSSITVGELAYLLGRLDPAHQGTETAVREIVATINDIPAHRLSAPSPQAVLEASIVSGIVARLTGRPKADRQPLLNDACLFLHALESGAVLLSRNLADMDLIAQLVPAGRMLLYRRAP